MSEASGSPAHKVYNIRHWSDGYIDVNPQGEVVIRPDRGHSAASINLPELTRRLEQAGVPLPVLIRFTDILHDRVNRLCRAFNTVAEAEGYRGRYTAVYPIKVNQQRRVVEELLTTEPAASAAMGSFHTLAENIRISDEEGRTLEGVVRALLRPMLKEWLDANLPSIVDEKVQAEIDRVARRRR